MTAPLARRAPILPLCLDPGQGQGGQSHFVIKTNLPVGRTFVPGICVRGPREGSSDSQLGAKESYPNPPPMVAIAMRTASIMISFDMLGSCRWRSAWLVS
jgi:hypothetical protein